jgi:hypothetical protein
MLQDLIPITQLTLYIPDAIDEQAWQSASRASNVDERWNIYLNQLLRQVLIPELQIDWPMLRLADASPEAAAINGVMVELNQKKMVLIPSRTIGDREVLIPQAWIDSPNHRGDYFISIQINPDEQLLTCSGYVTHQMVQARASYDQNSNCYELDSAYLIPDLAALWVIQQVNPMEVTQAAVVSTFSERLTTAAAQITTQLGNWLNQQVDAGWQSLTALLGEEQAMAYAWATRQNSTIGNNTIDRPTTTQAKAFSLSDRTLILLITLEQEEDGRTAIQIQLRTDNPETLLPPESQLELRSASGAVMQTVTARDADEAILLPRFRAVPGTAFSLHLSVAQANPPLDFSESFSL